MKRITLDFEGLADKGRLHEYLREQFGFPDYYGGNLDALYDELTSIMEETEIVFQEEAGRSASRAAAPAVEEMRQYLKKTRRVIEDAAEENGHLHL